ncbi:uncharacterized protein LOC119839172 [Zerene cesonia]|uniref:uncharacterized protein LOC119839172 n=1 Tax=Zerene cesonia TaxID=33412 RepID=UPI0018E4E0AB|nr:uncharacterized protein LOC119839172 [Zerene cesonia]
MYAYLFIAFLTTVSSVPNSGDGEAVAIERVTTCTKHNNSEGLITIHEDAQYNLNVILTDYKEENIEVRAKKETLGLILHCKHANGTEYGVEYYTRLPAYVSVNGTWIYENNILTITFPINKEASDNGIQQINKSNEKLPIPTQQQHTSNIEEDDSDISNPVAQRFPTWWKELSKSEFE